MKYFIAVAALLFALSTTPAEARRTRLWSPGIVMRMTFEGFMMNHTGPRLVWRGDWVLKRGR